MFGLNRESLVKNLKIIGGSLCAYAGGEWLTRQCDCKYGKGDEERCKGKMSETFSGCAELRQTVMVIDSLTDEEFKVLCKINRIVIVGKGV